MKISTVFTILITCGITAAVAYVIALKTEIIYKYPEPFYLSADEEAKRPVYQQLNSDEKAVYSSLLRGMHKQENEIPDLTNMLGMLGGGAPQQAQPSSGGILNILGKLIK